MASEARPLDTNVPEIEELPYQTSSTHESKDAQVIKISSLDHANEKSKTEIVEEEKQPEKVGDKTVKIAEETVELKKEDNIETKEVSKSKKDETFVSLDDVLSSKKAVKFASFKEESNLVSDLKELEKKALSELRSKIEESILKNDFSNDQKDPTTQENEAETEKSTPSKNAEDIEIWGIPLLPSKGDDRTDVILLKFLRARDFKMNESYQMLKDTVQWRKEKNIASTLNEDYGHDLASMAYMDGEDRLGHPICYNVYGGLKDHALYEKVFGSEEKVEVFLRWRYQIMEKGIQKLDFKPGGVSSLVQVNDLKNSPGPSKKELRLATKRAVGLLQDNYPEFVVKNIFINVPFWYYAFNALLSPFLSQRTKSKFVFARPAKVTETLLKYISADQIPIHYGGLKRENDSEFSTDDGFWDIYVKSGSIETIEIPADESGSTITWDLTVLGWEVNYKEEFVPPDEGSYTLIVSKGRKMGTQDVSIRNSFRNSEPGKVLLTIDNAGSFKKKRVLYRYKVKN